MIFKYLRFLITLFGIFAANGCRTENKHRLINKDVTNVIAQMTQIMVHDVTNPPLAARFFSYTCLAGYEVVAQNNDTFRSMKDILTEYPDVKQLKETSGYDYRLSAVLAMYETAGKMQPSGMMLKQFESSFLDSCRKIGYCDAVINASLLYAQFISSEILSYAKGDKYRKISNLPRYKIKETPGSWQVTPPAYMLPVEPYFNTIRPFTIDSASQFKSDLPIPFSTRKHSRFMKLLRLNYEKGGVRLTTEEKDAANFWDCNPFAVQNDGHMLIGLKKISPGAHWMGITGIACRQSNLSFEKTMEINTVVAIGLLDAFICCWDDKYRTNRVRPETAIRMYIDPDWRPLLQTPPFPEYISGHSVISSAAAVILSHYFGENYSYVDDVEVRYGIPPRHFFSFKQAAGQAAMSRFWGGIHFLDAIEKGALQGTNVGQWVIRKIGLDKRK
jgi:hypothetical protein